ncbi:hypothetical protein D1872_116790 [compost metagenome]
MRERASDALVFPIPLSAPHTASTIAIPTKDIQLPSRYTLPLANTSGEAEPNRTLKIGLYNTIINKLIHKASKETEEMVPDAALETMRSLPLPLYCATTTVPPVDTATNTLIRKIFKESIIFTALTAAIPDELIMAVFTKLRPTIKA